ncbi:hypothetical protein J6590_018908 [Homalodisca vitripennis]|nr:hypothetical protein J6590_018908 [Homalodisca vitripennis]
MASPSWDSVTCGRQDLSNLHPHLLSSYKNSELKEEKGSNIPKSCLESSPGFVTAENARSEHKSRVRETPTRTRDLHSLQAQGLD